MDPVELRRNTERLRPKDFADVYRLLHVITGEEARADFERGLADPHIADAVETGAQYVLEVLGEPGYVASMVADTWGDPAIEDEARRFISRWREQFRR